MYNLTKPTKLCLICYCPITQFRGRVKEWSGKKFCSISCHAKRSSLRPKESKLCETCDKVIIRATGLANVTWERKRFCGKTCWYKSNRTHKESSTSQVGFRLHNNEIDLLVKEASCKNVSLSELLRLGIRSFYKNLLKESATK